MDIQDTKNMPYLKPEIPFTNHHCGYPGIHVNFQGSGLPYSKNLAVGFGWFVGWKLRSCQGIPNSCAPNQEDMMNVINI